MGCEWSSESGSGYSKFRGFGPYGVCRKQKESEPNGAGEGRCVQAVMAEEGAGLDAPLCSNDNLQRWEVVGSGLVRLVTTQLCITVGGQQSQSPAGPLARRDLRIR